MKENEFTTSCFIRKNTKELKNKLEGLGYGEYAIIEGKCIAINQTKFITSFLTISELDGIDCGTNEELFLAIAALRDDSEDEQWFTDGTKWVHFSFTKSMSGNDFLIIKCNGWHKASAQELIDKFK